MDNSAKNEILDAIENVNKKIDIMQKEVAKISYIEKEVAKIPEMQKEIAKMQKEVAKIPYIEKEVAKIPEMQKEIAKIPEMQKDIRKISRSIAVIEYEHGDKLKALFDAFTTNTEKIDTQEKRIQFCEKTLDNHTSEIDYLTTKVQGL